MLAAQECADNIPGGEFRLGKMTHRKVPSRGGGIRETQRSLGHASPAPTRCCCLERNPPEDTVIAEDALQGRYMRNHN